MDVLNQVMGVQEASGLWGLSPDRVKGLCQSNKVQCKKVGNSWVLLKEQPNPKQQRLQGGEVLAGYTKREEEEVFLKGAREILSKVYPEFNDGQLWLENRGHFYSVMHGYGIQVAQIMPAQPDKFAENRKLVINREEKKDVQVVAQTEQYILRDIKELVRARVPLNTVETADWIDNRVVSRAGFLENRLTDQANQVDYKWRDNKISVKFKRVNPPKGYDEHDDYITVTRIE
ncbi:hypothetical protein [Oceanobacillus locisalsi]|uniref:Uncharacterized protein n=1 Tax=Oceanobacillus locisalsi TaxID=546107 RepID=A0ABW3NGJ9_9BACI